MGVEMRRPTISGIRLSGVIGGVQGGISTANLQQVLIEKGLTSANLAAAVKPASSVPTSGSATTSTQTTSTTDKSK